MDAAETCSGDRVGHKVLIVWLVSALDVYDKIHNCSIFFHQRVSTRSPFLLVFVCVHDTAELQNRVAEFPDKQTQ